MNFLITSHTMQDLSQDLIKGNTYYMIYTR